MLLTKLITIPATAMTLASFGHPGAGKCYAPDIVMGFEPTISKTKYNITNSAWNLTGAHNPQGGGTVFGLAYSPLYYTYEGQFSISQQEEGYCVSLDKIKVAYRARPIVFISREFPRGSCEFKEVVVHENKHVNTLKKFHADYAKPFKEKTINTLQRVEPILIENKSEIDRAQRIN